MDEFIYEVSHIDEYDEDWITYLKDSEILETIFPDKHQREFLIALAERMSKMREWHENDDQPHEKAIGLRIVNLERTFHRHRHRNDISYGSQAET